jgi:hypothetical protein
MNVAIFSGQMVGQPSFVTWQTRIGTFHHKPLATLQMTIPTCPFENLKNKTNRENNSLCGLMYKDEREACIKRYHNMP